jgi:mono/diheme cytochrome c family protein
VAKLNFRSVLMFTGLAVCSPLLGCSDGGAKPSCEGSDCEEQDSPVSEQEDAKVSDAGRKDASIRKDASAPAADKSIELPCDVKPLVSKYCGDCHGATPKFGAPMALVSASDFAKATPASVEQRVAETDPRKAMPPASSDQPSDEEKATLLAWLDKGAPGSSEKCSATPTPSRDAGTATPDSATPPPVDEQLECYKFLAHSGNGTGKFNVGAARDAYFNMTFKAQWKGTAYGIRISPIIDNDKVIHHWLLFQDDLPGTPNGIASSVGAHPAGQLLHGWAPGGDPLDLRNGGVDVGLELPGDGQTYTMEYHYNSSDIAAKDASGAEICVTKRKTANVAGVSWLGNDQLLIPSAKWAGTCRPNSKDPIHILAVVPHMHKQGTHMKATITRKDGSKEVLHDEPFDFNYQRLYEKNVTLLAGESILTECSFAQPMTFGTSTDAEMCYLFTVAYPKGALASLDAWGAFAHGGSSCLGQ